MGASVHACVFFLFFSGHNELICFQLHAHTPLTDSSALVWFCCDARGDICAVFCALSPRCQRRQAFTAQLRSQIGSGPCTSAFSLDANTLLGLLLRLGMMVGAEGQEATHASSSHWESRLLQGHLHRRPDWALWKSRAWRGSWRRRGRVEGKGGSQGLENKAHAIMGALPLFSLVASFSSFQRTPAKFRPAP